MSSEPLTARVLWSQTTEAIGDRVVARWLCEEAVALDGDGFLAEIDEPVTERMVAHLDRMVGRYRSGEPIQYVLGRWGFRNVDLAIDPRVLIPRPETELVAGVAIDLAQQAFDARGEVEVADLGTGSGAIGLSMAAELPLDGTHVWITDVDPDALDVARANLAGIGRAATNVRVAHGSWFEALPGLVSFDVIVSNPPYVSHGSPELEAQVAAWEPPGALFAGVSGLDHIAVIAEGARSRVRAGGWLVLEIGADQGTAVLELLEREGYDSVEIRQDLAGHDRIALGQRPIIR